MLFTGCSSTDSPERPHLYKKNTNAVVTNVDKKTWFSGTHYYEVNVTVEIEKYELTKKFTIKDAGAFNRPKEWKLEKGDIVEVTLYSWKKDSTGEVVKREIHSLN